MTRHSPFSRHDSNRLRAGFDRRTFATSVAALLMQACAASVLTEGKSSSGRPNEPPQATYLTLSRCGTTIGSPTLVFFSGWADTRNIWDPVVAALAPHYTCVTCDRPGYAGRQEATTPRDPTTIANEVHWTLADQGIHPPYILVGHSLGGLYAYAFAQLFRAEIVGLVLLDPAHPLQVKWLQESAPASAKWLREIVDSIPSASMRGEFYEGQKWVPSDQANQRLNCPRALLVSSEVPECQPGDEQAVAAIFQRSRIDWQTWLDAPMQVVKGDHGFNHSQPALVASAISSVVAKSLNNPRSMGRTR